MVTTLNPHTKTMNFAQKQNRSGVKIMSAEQLSYCKDMILSVGAPRDLINLEISRKYLWMHTDTHPPQKEQML